MASSTAQLLKAASRAQYHHLADLVRARADPNAADGDGSTPLTSVLSLIPFFKSRVVDKKLVKSRVYPLKDIQRTVQALLRAGADPNRSHPDLGTPLKIAASDGQLPIVRMLVQAGADPNPQDSVEDSPLVWAFYGRHLQVARYLLDHGANPRLKDQNGKSVLDIARRRTPENPKELSPIYQMFKQAAANFPAVRGLKKQEPPPGSKLGIKDFIALTHRGEPEWSLFAVQAPIDRVAEAFARLTRAQRWERQVAIEATRKFEPLARVAAVVKVKGNHWTIVFRSLFTVSSRELASVPEEARKLSKALDTKAITFACEATSGAMGYTLYAQGRVMEEAEWERGHPLGRFSSKLRQDPELRKVTDDFADQVFRWQGIYLPACYPREETHRSWLAVDDCSVRLVERADLIEPTQTLPGKKSIPLVPFLRKLHIKPPKDKAWRRPIPKAAGERPSV
jgi:hypothetical protein